MKINAQVRISIVKETVISCVEAPRLKGISTRHFIEFMRLIKLYEKQIEVKWKHLKEDIIPMSHRALIKDDDLKNFIAVEWVQCSSMDELSKMQIKQCVDERSKREVTGEQL